MSVLGARLCALGLLSKSGPSIWVHTENFASIERAVPVIARLKKRAPRYGIAVTAPGVGLRTRVRALLPDARVLAPPRASDIALWVFFRAIRPHCVLVVGSGARLCQGALRRAKRVPAKIGLLEGVTPWTSVMPRRELLAAADLIIVQFEESGRHLSKDKAVGCPVTSLEATSPDSAALKILEPAWRTLAEPQAANAPSLPVRTARAILDSGVLRRGLGKASRRIDSLSELYDALGRPRSILCLGNGPSSTDPQLHGVEADALFRVNHRWKGSPLHGRPDMVFTNSPETVSALVPDLFGFPTKENEAQILSRCLFRAQPIRFVTMERLPLSINGLDWAALPTNGAVMVSLAAALRPDRLIIAGIDLFAHPRGAYPDAPEEANMYYLVHDRSVDVAVIRLALASFRGNVSIFGEQLAAVLHSEKDASGLTS